MKISEKLKNFLSIPETQQRIATNKFKSVYKELNDLLPEETSNFTELLYASDIDPIKYMDEIPGNFLRDSKIKNFTVKNNIKKIGNSAFYNCRGLTSITIPDSVTSIGASAFESCVNLKDIIIPNSIDTIRCRTFFKCRSLTNIGIPKSLKEIEYDAFRSCINLTDISIPDSIKYIGDNAFYGCENLTNITIPNSVIEIGDSVFGNSIFFPDCPNLKITCYSERVKNLLIKSGVDENKIKVI